MEIESSKGWGSPLYFPFTLKKHSSQNLRPNMCVNLQINSKLLQDRFDLLLLLPGNIIYYM